MMAMAMDMEIDITTPTHTHPQRERERDDESSMCARTLVVTDQSMNARNVWSGLARRSRRPEIIDDVTPAAAASSAE